MPLHNKALQSRGCLTQPLRTECPDITQNNLNGFRSLIVLVRQFPIPIDSFDGEGPASSNGMHHRNCHGIDDRDVGGWLMSGDIVWKQMGIPAELRAPGICGLSFGNRSRQPCRRRKGCCRPESPGIVLTLGDYWKQAGFGMGRVSEGFLTMPSGILETYEAFRNFYVIVSELIPTATYDADILLCYCRVLSTADGGIEALTYMTSFVHEKYLSGTDGIAGASTILTMHKTFLNSDVSVTSLHLLIDAPSLT
ncbi:hypothetical protein AVEN_82372-1 [Araneus ventricosus]|uniref:Uncharacterized protein n=1 Tax=Araneus ventricosus TaxID=182803 RepID=A0A4Y2HJH9_ARAVE|nr:hypothetical protein AVEN_82372-1 [Araneus ventricosus]